jgi:hypothetical protein
MHLVSGRGCPQDISISRMSGTTIWKPDSINIAIVRAAITTLDLRHFGNHHIAWKFMYRPEGWLTNLRALYGDRWSLDANQLLLSRALGIIGKLPPMTEDEIEHLDKSGVCVEVFAVSQVSWLCIQLITRLARGLPTTQLEIITSAFTVCSIATHSLLYNRPKDVLNVREVEAAKYPTPAELTQITNAGPTVFGPWRSDAAIPNNSAHWTTGRSFEWSSTVAMIVFGMMHLVSWNSQFPTQVERTLWRTSIFVTIIALPIVGLCMLLTKSRIRLSSLKRSRRPLVWQERRFPQLAFWVELWLVAPLCIAVRIFITVEVVRSLPYQPPEAFRNTWAANVPHVG